MPESVAQSRETRSEPEADLLVACARTHITPEIADRIRALVQKKVDWLALISLAMRHDVMSLLYRSLQQICPDSTLENILGPLRARSEAKAALARRQAEELLRILSLFKERGLFAVPYKGPALAQRLYGDVSLREFNDLDIMIFERDVPRALELIRSLGYEFNSPRDAENLPEYVRTNREFQFYRSGGTRLELQWRFTTRLTCVQQDPERFLRRIETISLASGQVFSLPLEAYFLVLCLHATKHEWKELKLICDLAEIMRQADIDWRYVLREADDLGLKRMLTVGVLLAEDPLEMVTPAELAKGLKIDRPAQALAAQVRRSLFKDKPDEGWGDTADFPFQFKIRERLRDKARMLYRNLPSKLAPDERDREFMPMPDCFSSMYYLVRPVRWAWDKMNER